MKSDDTKKQSEKNEESSQQSLQTDTSPNITSVEQFLKIQKEQSVSIFKHLDQHVQEQIIRKYLDDNETQTIEELLLTVESPKALYLLQRLSQKQFKELFSEAFVEHLNESLKFPKESVGQISTYTYIAIPDNWTVKQVLEYIRLRTDEDLEEQTTIFVVKSDTTWKFEGSISFAELIMANETDKIDKIMRTDVASISAFEDRENTIMIMSYYKMLDIPVVDKKRRLTSIVNMKKVMEVQMIETSEDIQKGAAMIPGGDYTKTNIFWLYLKRVLWMVVLMLLALLSSTVLKVFEHTLAQNIALSLFIPILIDTGGNTGHQSSTILIRAISTKEINIKNCWRVFVKEAIVSTMIAATLAITIFPLGWVFGKIVGIGLVVAVSVWVITWVANTSGIILPLLFTAVRLDPAVATGPLVTTFLDIVGLLIYFALAQLILVVFGLGSTAPGSGSGN